MMHTCRFVAIALVLVAPSVLAVESVYDAGTNQFPAAPFVRFDASHPGSTSPVLPLPGFPPNPYFGTGFTPTSPAQSVGGGIYDSGLSDVGKYTFWYNDSLVLDETKTIELSARLKVISSTTPAEARAGVALALTTTQNKYTEVYLLGNQIFVNDPGRIKGQTFAIDTTAAFHDYLLRVQGGTVNVFIDGIQRLTGVTFDASTVNAPTLANWGVLGDITSNAGGEYQIQRFSVAVVPEPGTSICLAALGLTLTRRLRGRSVRSK